MFPAQHIIGFENTNLPRFVSDNFDTGIPMNSLNIVSFFFDGHKTSVFFELCVFDFEILVLNAQKADLDVQTCF